MKKTVLAFAVAAAMGVPAVAAADTTLYGRFNVSLDRVDNDTTKSTQLASNSSRIGIRGSEDLGGGLRGVFQVEGGIDGGTSTNVTGTTYGGNWGATRNTFVGLAGDFGEVRLGRHDTPYKISTLRLNFTADTVADIHNVMGRYDEGNFYTRDDNMILYMSPNFEGFQVMVSYVTDRTSDRPIELDNDDVVANVNANDRDAYSLAGTYTNGPIFVAAAYENRNAVTGGDDQKAWKIGGTYQIEDLTLAAMFENIKVGSDDRDAWNISARYRMGQAYIAATYAQADDFGGADSGAEMFGLAVGYDLSRRTGVYAAYAQVDNDDETNAYGILSGKGKGVVGVSGADGADISGFSVGVWHNF